MFASVLLSRSERNSEIPAACWFFFTYSYYAHRRPADSQKLCMYPVCNLELFARYFSRNLTAYVRMLSHSHQAALDSPLKMAYQVIGFCCAFRVHRVLRYIMDGVMPLAGQSRSGSGFVPTRVRFFHVRLRCFARVLTIACLTDTVPDIPGPLTRNGCLLSMYDTLETIRVRDPHIFFTPAASVLMFSFSEKPL